MRALRPTVSEAARHQRLQQMLKQTPQGRWTWRYDHAGIAATRLDPDPARVVDLRPSVQAIQCPTLVIRGGRSDYLQPEMVSEMLRLNPTLQATEIADAGHYIHDDQAERFNQVVWQFLSRQP
jgi:pimeloyl-ACP methyl ester carboxylesterase